MRTVVKRVLFTVVCAALGVGGVNAGDAKPAAKEAADDAAWFPPVTAYRVNWRDSPRKSIPLPPSAFPGLTVTPVEWDKKEDTYSFMMARERSLGKLCPRLRGQAALKIEPTDDALRKLLKARAHQLILEYQEEQRPYAISGPEPYLTVRYGNHLLEMRSVLTELHVGQPKELTPWLEELIVAAKELERYARLRVEAGALKPNEMAFATCVRLQLESALWGMKNPGAEPVRGQPVRTGEKAPIEGHWLADKKVAPSLFPDLVPPALEESDFDRHWWALVVARRVLQYAALCPRLFGTSALKIESTDDTARKLLKARLHQGTLQFRLTQQRPIGIPSNPSDFILDASCLLDMQAAVAGLWLGQPKELVSWLEELLIAAKDQERYTQRQIEARVVRQPQLNHATQVRLKIEAELWKAKNAK